MPEIRNEKFDPRAVLAKAGAGRMVIQLNAKAVIFSQGDEADAVFYIQSGRAKLTVVSEGGKRATITLLSVRYLVGEESVTSIVSEGVIRIIVPLITGCEVEPSEKCPPAHPSVKSREHWPEDAVFKAITMLNVFSTLALTITASDVHGDQSGVNVAIIVD